MSRPWQAASLRDGDRVWAFYGHSRVEMISATVVVRNGTMYLRDDDGLLRKFAPLAIGVDHGWFLSEDKCRDAAYRFASESGADISC